MTITVDFTAEEGTNSAGTSYQTGFHSTSGANRVLLFYVCVTGAGTTLSSVTDTSGLTWHKRGSVSNTDTGGGVQDCELWWAYAPTQLTNFRVTANYGASTTVATCLIAVAGVYDPTAPWDGNASLPNTAVNSSNSSSATVQATGVYTDSTNHMQLAFFSTRSFTTPAAPAGWTDLGADNQEPGAGGNRSYIRGNYLIESAKQTNETVASATSTTAWTVLVDALASDAPLVKSTSFTATVIA